MDVVDALCLHGPEEVRVRQERAAVDGVILVIDAHVPPSVVRAIPGASYVNDFEFGLLYMGASAEALLRRALGFGAIVFDHQLRDARWQDKVYAFIDGLDTPLPAMDVFDLLARAFGSTRAAEVKKRADFDDVVQPWDVELALLQINS